MSKLWNVIYLLLLIRFFVVFDWTKYKVQDEPSIIFFCLFCQLLGVHCHIDDPQRAWDMVMEKNIITNYLCVLSQKFYIPPIIFAFACKTFQERFLGERVF